ncbi:MAG: GxxExxY protein [Bacteroidetes bacterium]|nr:MAG: GxxExxY protein [Bacteroidota bacterium]
MKIDNLLYPELSFKIVGCAFDVFNQIGGGHKEVTYHKAFGLALTEGGLSYLENLYYPIKYDNVAVERGYFDYQVEEKIVVELKSRDGFLKKDFEQLSNYLNNSNLKLGIPISFGRTQVKFKKVLNVELLNRAKAIGLPQIRYIRNKLVY